MWALSKCSKHYDKHSQIRDLRLAEATPQRLFSAELAKSDHRQQACALKAVDQFPEIKGLGI
jgi:hypothetical protein